MVIEEIFRAEQDLLADRYRELGKRIAKNKSQDSTLHSWMYDAPEFFRKQAKDRKCSVVRR